MNRVSNVYKIIAVFTALCLECTSFSIPLARAEAIPQSATSIKKLNPELLKLPAKFGEVVESHAGNGNVIVVQDAHAIPDAQRNIANVIKYMQQEYGVGTVALEGASGDLDPQIFRSFPDKKLLRYVMKGYMDAGEIAGGTAAAIFDETATKYQGVENWDVYEEGLGLYLSAMDKTSAIEAQLFDLREKLNKEKEAIYPRALLEVDHEIEKFYENAAQLTELIKVLGAIQAPKPGSELEAVWKEVSKAHSPATGGESKDIEVRALAAKVEKVLKSPGAVKAFNSRKQEWMTGQISAEAFALNLKEFADQSGLNLEMSSDLLGMVRDQQTLKGLEGTKLFRDLEAYIREVKMQLTQRQQTDVSVSGVNAEMSAIQALDERTNSLRVLTKLSKLELSRQEWTNLSGDLVFEAFAALGLKQEDFLFHLAFYLNAEERDQIFFDNLKESISGSRPSVIVAGGFHAEGITSRLKEAGMGYALVMPKINHIPENNSYKAQMRGEVSWKEYFEVENGRIHLYKAFVRATRDQLLKADGKTYNVNRKANDQVRSTNYALLKSWRDQIIRDLSDMGKVDRAAWYTRYMDEVVDESLKHTDADKLMSKVDNFIRGLRGLEKANQLNSEQIAALLKANMIPSAYVIPSNIEVLTEGGLKEVAAGVANARAMVFEGRRFEVSEPSDGNSIVQANRPQIITPDQLTTAEIDQYGKSFRSELRIPGLVGRRGEVPKSRKARWWNFSSPKGGLPARVIRRVLARNNIPVFYPNLDHPMIGFVLTKEGRESYFQSIFQNSPWEEKDVLDELSISKTAGMIVHRGDDNDSAYQKILDREAPGSSAAIVINPFTETRLDREKNRNTFLDALMQIWRSIARQQTINYQSLMEEAIHAFQGTLYPANGLFLYEIVNDVFQIVLASDVQDVKSSYTWFTTDEKKVLQERYLKVAAESRAKPFDAILNAIASDMFSDAELVSGRTLVALIGQQPIAKKQKIDLEFPGSGPFSGAKKGEAFLVADSTVGPNGLTKFNLDADDINASRIREVMTYYLRVSDQKLDEQAEFVSYLLKLADSKRSEARFLKSGKRHSEFKKLLAAENDGLQRALGHLGQYEQALKNIEIYRQANPGMNPEELRGRAVAYVEDFPGRMKTLLSAWTNGTRGAELVDYYFKPGMELTPQDNQALRNILQMNASNVLESLGTYLERDKIIVAFIKSLWNIFRGFDRSLKKTFQNLFNGVFIFRLGLIASAALVIVFAAMSFSQFDGAARGDIALQQLLRGIERGSKSFSIKNRILENAQIERVQGSVFNQKNMLLIAVPGMDGHSGALLLAHFGKSLDQAEVWMAQTAPKVLQKSPLGPNGQLGKIAESRPDGALAHFSDGTSQFISWAEFKEVSVEELGVKNIDQLLGPFAARSETRSDNLATDRRAFLKAAAGVLGSFFLPRLSVGAEISENVTEYGELRYKAMIRIRKDNIESDIRAFIQELEATVAVNLSEENAEKMFQNLKSRFPDGISGEIDITNEIHAMYVFMNLQIAPPFFTGEIKKQGKIFPMYFSPKHYTGAQTSGTTYENAVFIYMEPILRDWNAMLFHGREVRGMPSEVVTAFKQLQSSVWLDDAVAHIQATIAHERHHFEVDEKQLSNKLYRLFPDKGSEELYTTKSEASGYLAGLAFGDKPENYAFMLVQHMQGNGSESASLPHQLAARFVLQNVLEKVGFFTWLKESGVSVDEKSKASLIESYVDISDFIIKKKLNSDEGRKKIKQAARDVYQEWFDVTIPDFGEIQVDPSVREYLKANNRFARSEARSANSGQARVDRTEEVRRNGTLTVEGKTIVFGPQANKDLPIGVSPEVLFVDLDRADFVTKAETFLFQSLFFAAAFLKIPVGKEQKLKNYKELFEALLSAKAAADNADSGGLNAAQEILKQVQVEKDEFVAEAQKKGFAEFLLPGGILSRRMEIFVPNENQREGLLKYLTLSFVSQSKESLRSDILKLQQKLGFNFDPAVLEQLLAEFESKRSFMFPGGVFAGKTDAEIQDILGQFIQVKVLSQTQSVSSSVGSIQLTPSGVLVIGAGQSEVTVDWNQVFKSGDLAQAWSEAFTAQLNKALSFKDGKLRVFNLGTGDPTPFSQKQDYTHMAFIVNGKMIVTDPSIRSIRNLERLGLLEKVEAIHLTHVHFDHVGGILDIARRKLKKSESLPKLKLVMPTVVAVQLERTLAYNFSTMSVDSNYDFSQLSLVGEVFDYRGPEKINKTIEISQLQESAEFKGVQIELAPTFGHPIPTYGVKLITQEGLKIAYLSDSMMPTPTIITADKEVPNPRYLEFVSYYADSDILIAENGVKGVHITPEQLAEAFPGHINNGTLFTVHSSGPQAQKGLIRFMPGMILSPLQSNQRKQDVQQSAATLIENEAIRDFLKLNSKLAQELSSMGTKVSFPEGEVLFQQGNPVYDFDHVYISLSGETIVEGPGAKRLPSIGAGRLIGEMALLTKALELEQYEQIMGAIGQGKDPAALDFFGRVTYDLVIEGQPPYRIVNPSLDLEKEAKGLTEDQKLKLKPVFDIAKSGKPIPRSVTVRAGAGATYLAIPKDAFLQFLTRIDASKIDSSRQAFISAIYAQIGINLDSRKKLSDLATPTQNGTGGVKASAGLDPSLKRSEFRTDSEKMQSYQRLLDANTSVKRLLESRPRNPGKADDWRGFARDVFSKMRFFNQYSKEILSLDFENQQLVELIDQKLNEINKVWQTGLERLDAPNIDVQREADVLFRKSILGLREAYLRDVRMNIYGFQMPSRRVDQISRVISGASSLNELLHALHVMMTTDETVFQSLPSIQDQNLIPLDYANKVFAYGQPNELMRSFALKLIQKLESKKLNSGMVILFAPNLERLTVVVRDYGHALNIDMHQSEGRVWINYSIPKAVGENRVASLRGLNRFDPGVLLDPTTAFAFGDFAYQQSDDWAEGILEFISQVPQDQSARSEARIPIGNINDVNLKKFLALANEVAPGKIEIFGGVARDLAVRRSLRQPLDDLVKTDGDIDIVIRAATLIEGQKIFEELKRRVLGSAARVSGESSNRFYAKKNDGGKVLFELLAFRSVDGVLVAAEETHQAYFDGAQLSFETMSLMINPDTEAVELHDPYSGVEDIVLRKVRFATNQAPTMADVMRGLTRVHQLGWQWDIETLEQVKRYLGNLRAIGEKEGEGVLQSNESPFLLAEYSKSVRDYQGFRLRMASSSKLEQKDTVELESKINLLIASYERYLGKNINEMMGRATSLSARMRTARNLTVGDSTKALIDLDRAIEEGDLGLAILPGLSLPVIKDVAYINPRNFFGISGGVSALLRDAKDANAALAALNELGLIDMLKLLGIDLEKGLLQREVLARDSTDPDKRELLELHEVLKRGDIEFKSNKTLRKIEAVNYRDSISALEADSYQAQIVELKSEIDRYAEVEVKYGFPPTFQSIVRRLQAAEKRISGLNRSEAREAEAVAADVFGFFKSPADYSADQINNLADEIQSLADKQGLDAFINILRSIAQDLAVWTLAPESAGIISPVEANLFSKVETGRMIIALSSFASASNLEKPTVGLPFKVTDQQVEALKQKLSPELSQLLGGIQLQHENLKNLGKLFQDKGITPSNIDPKLANAVVFNDAPDLEWETLPGIGVLKEPQQFDSELEGARIHLQILIASYLAVRFPDKKMALTKEIVGEINKALFQLGEAQEGIIQIDANGRLVIKQSSLLTYIQTLFKAQTAVAVAA